MKTMLMLWMLMLLIVMPACSDDGEEGPAADGDVESAADGDGEEAPIMDGDEEFPSDGDGELPPVMDGDEEGDREAEAEGDIEYTRQESLTPPPAPADELGYDPPEREAVGTPPTPAEITAFTKKITAFFKDTNYFDWVYRTSHGLHESYDAEMFSYKLWWQDTGMRKDGDTVVFRHHGRAENIAKRSVKVLSNAAAGHLLTGDTRMAEVAAQLMRGMVALSLGMEFEGEDPLVKYLQSRAVFNHNHSYEVDGRKVSIEYDGMYTPSFKWNVHVFNIPDNPTFGDIWVSNMRSKDDVPYMFTVLNIATQVYHESENAELKAAAELFIEYMRGFAQSIVDNDWYILTKYEDGLATIAVDATKEENPPADLGSFVHWTDLFGPDGECTAQLGAAMAGYGFPAGKGDCEGGLSGWPLERFATTTHFFNYNIYNYFHISALATAQLWGYWDIASSLMDGLVWRFEEIRNNPEMPNTDDKEFDSDRAGWLITAATHGFPLNAEEAGHIMQWYGDSSDWYRQWPHWDPWASLNDGEEFTEYKAPRDKPVDDGEGGQKLLSYVRLVEMPYIFEYCHSPIRNRGGVEFIDCAIVADPAQWGE